MTSAAAAPRAVPGELAEFLTSHPGGADMPLVHAEDSLATLGEVTAAARALVGQLGFARRSLAGYKTPVAVRFVDDFPRAEIGKVLRRVLVAGFEPGRPAGGTETG